MKSKLSYKDLGNTMILGVIIKSNISILNELKFNIDIDVDTIYKYDNYYTVNLENSKLDKYITVKLTDRNLEGLLELISMGCDLVIDCSHDLRYCMIRRL